MFNSDGSINAPQGVRGGRDGARAEQLLRDRTGELRELKNYDRVVLARGETIVSICSAGGGYGSPLERDPELVQRDVLERFVTPSRAEEVYGVVLTDEGAVDVEATITLRERRRLAP